MTTSTATDQPSETYPSELTLFLAGRWVERGGRESIPVIDPSDERQLAELPVATPEDLDEALEAADRAFPAWRQAGPSERARVLRTAAALLRERREAIATTATIEQGKTRAEMLAEVDLAAATLDWCAEEGRRTYGRLLTRQAPGVRAMVVREPVGPVAAFSPWNFPLINPARKIGAALGAGCTCVLKPAEEAPASALAIARALADAGLPEGVLSVVFGVPAQISEQLIASPLIRKVSFTGSVPVGKQLTKLAAAGMKRTTMELGGHAPVVVLADADLDQAVAHSVFAKHRNAGQICVSPTRFYVENSVYDPFAEAFAAGARGLVVGSGLDASTQMGPLAHERRIAAVGALVEDAVDRGATLLAGGHPIDRPGYFWEPTVLADVPADARVMREEPFGPIAVLAPVDGLDEALAQANGLPYGLAAYGFTRDARATRELASQLEAGIVGINTYAIAAPDAPFGGVKESGHGCEDGVEGIEGCLVTKSVHEA